MREKDKYIIYHDKINNYQMKQFHNSFFFLVLTVIFLFALTNGQETSQEAEKEPLSEWSKQWLEEVVPYIITKAERSVFLSLPNEEERGKFIQKFWEKRDPDPSTPENEFKILYYKRIAIANKLFGRGGRDGWRTDRGKIFILLGPPQEIQTDFIPSSGLSYQHGEKQTWSYWGLDNPRLPYNLEFAFVDKFGSGDFVLEESLNVGQYGRLAYDISSLHYHFDRMELIAEAMKNPFENIKKLEGQVITQVSYDLIPIKSNILFLKGPLEQSYIPIVFEIPYNNLSPRMIDDRYYYSLDLIIKISNEEGNVISQKTRGINLDCSLSELPSLSGSLYRFQSGLFLPPGEYGLQIIILDNFSGKIGSQLDHLSVQDFSEDRLSLSSIVLSTEPISREKLKVENRKEAPTEVNIFTGLKDTFSSEGEIFVYFEIYNLSLNMEKVSQLSVDYLIFQDDKLIARISRNEQTASGEKDCQVQTSLKVKNLNPGKYLLKIQVKDKFSGKESEEEILFRITD